MVPPNAAATVLRRLQPQPLQQPRDRHVDGLLEVDGPQGLARFDHAEHVDHAGGVVVVLEVDQVDHAPDRPVRERKHIASCDRCRRMSYPEIAAVGALQSDLDSHVHATSMPSAPAERDDPIMSYPGKTASTTFV